MERQVAERQVAVRPHFWRQMPVALQLLVYLGVFIWIFLDSHIDPGTGWGIVVAFILLGGLFAFETYWQIILVTDEEVRIKRVRRAPPIPRAQIFNIRALRWNTVFYDHNQNAILKTGLDLSRSQLLVLANALEVNVWDHRAWHGLKELEHGVRLNPEPGASGGAAEPLTACIPSDAAGSASVGGRLRPMVACRR